MKAIYPGSFDPFTKGHLDIVKRAFKIFPELTIGVGSHPRKSYTFTKEERVSLIKETLVMHGLSDVKVEQVEGLTIDFAKLRGFKYLIKGARTTQDFDYERLNNDISITQQRGIETILLFSDPQTNLISSSSTKILAEHCGLIHDFVTLNVKAALEQKYGRKIIGVTGTIGSGKSTLCAQMVEYFSTVSDVKYHHINLDKIGHQLFESSSEMAVETRVKILETFGTVDRKELGQIVFGDKTKLKQLNDINREPLLTLLRMALAEKQGIIFLEGALLAELGWLNICNNNVILVKQPELAVWENRLKKRGYTDEQIKSRVSSQYSFERKLEAIESSIREANYGKIILHESINGGVLSNNIDLINRLL